MLGQCQDVLQSSQGVMTLVGDSGPWCEPSSFSLQHKYTSIAEVQVHMEDEYLRSPLSGVSVGWGWDEAPELELWACGSAWCFSSREGWVCSAGR